MSSRRKGMMSVDSWVSTSMFQRFCDAGRSVVLPATASASDAGGERSRFVSPTCTAPTSPCVLPSSGMALATTATTIVARHLYLPRRYRCARLAFGRNALRDYVGGRPVAELRIGNEVISEFGAIRRHLDGLHGAGLHQPVSHLRPEQRERVSSRGREALLRGTHRDVWLERLSDAQRWHAASTAGRNDVRSGVCAGRRIGAGRVRGPKRREPAECRHNRSAPIWVFAGAIRTSPTGLGVTCAALMLLTALAMRRARSVRAARTRRAEMNHRRIGFVTAMFTTAMIVGLSPLAAEAKLGAASSSTVSFTAKATGGFRIVGTTSELRVDDDGTNPIVVAEADQPIDRPGPHDEHTRKALETDWFPTAELTAPRASLKFPTGGETEADASGTSKPSTEQPGRCRFTTLRRRTGPTLPSRPPRISTSTTLACRPRTIWG